MLIRILSLLDSLQQCTQVIILQLCSYKPKFHSNGGWQERLEPSIVILQLLVDCDRNSIVTVISHNFSKTTITDISMITCSYSGAVCKYRITKGSHINTSISNIYNYCLRGFIRMYFKVTNTLFSVKTNVVGLNGTICTNKSLLFMFNPCINTNSLSFVPIQLAP